MTDVRSTRLLAPCLVMASVLAGCSRRPARVAPPGSLHSRQQAGRAFVTDFVDFTGRTEAIHSVDIRPRATGYLVEMPFKEGTEVKTGDLLFVIDPRPYKAQLDQAQGQVNLYQAQLKLARTTLARDLAINRHHAQRREPAAARPGGSGRRGGRRPGQGLREEHGGLPAQPRIHQGHLADRRHGQPLLPDRGQPRQPGPDAAHHGRLARPDVRLFRRGRADRPARPEGDQRGPDQAPVERHEDPRPDGTPGRVGLPARGRGRLHQQPAQSHHRQHPHARGVRQPETRRRAYDSSRRGCSSASACRSASRIRRSW